MKIKRLERMRDSQRAYHRNCQWVMENGIRALHLYDQVQPDDLSWWDDVGFILGKRRVMVWWVHPRFLYSNEVGEQAFRLVGEPPEGGLLGNMGTPSYKRVGRSRKKIVGYSSQPAQGAVREYYDTLFATEQRLQQEGIDFEVRPSWRRERLPWATGVALVAPVEVRNEAELKQLADLARRLLRGETTLQREFPDYCYGKQQWLADQAILAEKKDKAE